MSLGSLQDEADLKRWLQSQLETLGLLPSPPAPTIIRGSVETEGGISSGVGFTVNKTGTGVYEITLATKLGSVGNLLALPTTLNRGIRNSASSNQVFTVNVVDLSEVAANGGFNFWVVPG